MKKSPEEELRALTKRLASCDCWVCDEDRLGDLTDDPTSKE